MAEPVHVTTEEPTLGPESTEMEQPPAVTSGWRSSELWLTVATTAVAILVLLGVIPVSRQDEVTSAITAVISGLFVILANVKYQQVRESVKVEAIRAAKEVALAEEATYRAVEVAEAQAKGKVA